MKSRWKIVSRFNVARVNQILQFPSLSFREARASSLICVISLEFRFQTSVRRLSRESREPFRKMFSDSFELLEIYSSFLIKISIAWSGRNMQIAEVETFRYFRIRQRGWGREKLRSSSFQHTSETIESSNSTAIMTKMRFSRRCFALA